MVDDLHAKRELLEAKVNKLREAFSGRLDDIKGLDSNSGIKNFYPGSRYADEKKPLEGKSK